MAVASCAPSPAARLDLAALADAVGPNRTFAGRVGNAPYQPRFTGPVRPPRKPTRLADLRDAAEARLRASHHADTLADAARIDLFVGRFASANARLREAIELADDRADLWNDLAVVELAEADVSEAGASAAHVIAALDAARRAFTLAPTRPEALFNLAAIADRVDARDMAAQARRQLAAHEMAADWKRDPAWSSPPRPAVTAVDVLVTNIVTRAPTREADLGALLARPRDARTYFFSTALPQIAGQGADDPRRAALLELATRLDVSTGGTRLSSCLRAAAGDRRASVTDAAGALTRGFAANAESQFEIAASAFATAALGFREVASPCAAVADVERDVARVLTGDRSVEPGLTRAAGAATREHDASLAGRALWGLGLLQQRRGDIERALVTYERALDAFRSSRDFDSAAAVRRVAADAHRSIGDDTAGWDDVAASLQDAAHVSDPLRRYLLFFNASLFAADAQLPFAALALQDEALAEARRRNVAGSIAEALVRRAQLLRATGAAADQDVAEATRIVTDLRSAAEREYQTMWLDRVRAEQAALSMPTPAGSPFTRDLIERFARVEPEEVPSLYLAAGRAANAAKQPGAIAEFRSGLAAVSRQLATVSRADHRASLLDRAWDLQNELVALQWTQQGPDAALLHTLAARGYAPDVTVAAAMVHAVTGRVVIAFAVLPDQTLAWRIDARGVRGARIAIRAAQLARLVESYRRSIEAGHARDELRAAGQHLFATLLDPLGFTDGDAAVQVLPDGPLNDLPFAALIDRSGRFLVEQHAVQVVHATRRETRRGGAQSGTPRALLVSYAGDGSAALAALPGERRSLAAIYPGALRLDGVDATPARFLRDAPTAAIIHFGGHAEVNATLPWKSYLQLAPDQAHPSGRLTASDLGALDLRRTHLVVLAACETATGRVFRGQGPFSLARPFLERGVADVVGTLWKADDGAAAAIVVALHREVRVVGVPAALRRAQLAALNGQDPAMQLARAWAAFVDMTPWTY